MKVCLGPVAPARAAAWTGWTREIIGEMRTRPRSADKLPAQVLDDIDRYVEAWEARTRLDQDFQWQCDVDVDVDELEYLTSALYNLDLRLVDEARRTLAVH